MANFIIGFVVIAALLIAAIVTLISVFALNIKAKKSAKTSTVSTDSSSTTTVTTAPEPDRRLNWRIVTGVVGLIVLMIVLWQYGGKLLTMLPWSVQGSLPSIELPTSVTLPDVPDLPTSISFKTWFFGIVLGALLWYFAGEIFSGTASKVAKVAAALILLFMLWMTPYSTSIHEFLVGSRPRLVTKQTSTALPIGVPASVIVPACGGKKSWSGAIQIPAGWNVTSSWNMDTVQAAWRENGEWKQFSGKYLSGSFDAVKYCAKNSSYAGEEMLLTWTVR